MSCLKNYFTGLMLFSVAAAYSIAPQEKIQEKHVMISGFTGVADEEPEYVFLFPMAGYTVLTSRIC